MLQIDSEPTAISMKQVLQSLRTSELIVADVPVPAVPDNGVLVRSIASLVSPGTERMVLEFAKKNLLQKARSRPELVRQVLQRARREGVLSTFDVVARRLGEPMPLGYSLVGEVVDVGSATRDAAVGDLVACAGAGVANHAEFVAVPQHLFARLPPRFVESAPVEEAAFATLGAIALHGFRLAKPQIGDRIAVLGLGLLGQLAVQIAHAAGCAVFGVDLDPARVALALQHGAGAASLRAEAVDSGSAFTGGAGFDVVLIAADSRSNDPVELAATLARDRAHVVALGAIDLALPRKPFFSKELHFQVSRSYGPGRYDPNYELHGRDYPVGYVRWTEQRNLAAFVELLASRRCSVGSLITHRFEIADASRAYEVITGNTTEPFLGVLLRYPADAQITRRVDHASVVARAPQPRSAGVSVIGAGLFAATTLVPALKRVPNVRLRGVVSAQGLTARSLAESSGFAFSATTLEEALRDRETDAVFILTRHHLHAAQTIAALEAGKHVFVEKPLCLTEDELDEIQLAHERHPDRLLLVGFNRRFAPLAHRLRTFLGTGEPTLLTYRVNAGYLPPDHWTQDPEQGGGRLLGEGCHFFDFANWIQGERPVQVFARAAADSGKYRQDNFVVTLAYSSGGVAAITYVANGEKNAGKERIEAFSGGRTAILTDFRLLELSRDGRTERFRDRLKADKGHFDECRMFLDAVCAGAPSPIPFDELADSTRTTLAAAESLATGQPIPLH
jgi:predicted dehydrogenase/threonine dehydrogenase-like Zn-dependent dehydrogenase